LRINSASIYFSLQGCIEIHGQQNVKFIKIICVHVDGIHLAPDEEQC